MSGFRIEGNTSGNVAEVTSNNEVKTAQTTTAANAGYSAIAVRHDAGAVTSTATVRPIYGTLNKSLTTAQLISLFNDYFNVSSGVNPLNYQARTSTMTVTTAAGTLTLNAGSITTASTSACVQTYRSIPILGDSTVVMEIRAYRTTAPQANEQMEFGLFTCSTVGATAVQDGVFFRYNPAGELRGVVSYNGTETQTGAMTPPAVNQVHEFKIEMSDDDVYFWIDDVIYGDIELSTDAPTQPVTFMAVSAPFTARYFIASSGPAIGTQLKITDINIYAYDVASNKPWQQKLAGMGRHAYQAQNGSATYGTIQQYGNSVNPAVAVPTNTAASVGSGLGGVFNVSTTPAASTDVIISSYQNPLGSVNQMPRTLYINGVTIDTMVVVASSNQSLGLAWSLAFGHNAVSLATSSNAATGVTGANRIALGHQLISSTAATGTVANTVSRQFATPIPVMPGQFIQTVWRNNLTASVFGQLQHAVTFDGYFE